MGFNSAFKGLMLQTDVKNNITIIRLPSHLLILIYSLWISAFLGL
jgi:hypothetical protein